MGRMEREKGKRGEREAARAVEEYLGVTARRGQQRVGGPDSPDIIVSIPKVHVEVKRVEKLSLYTAIEQAIQEADGEIPLVLHRRNGKQWLAVVPLDRLMDLAVTLYLTKAENG